MPPNTHTSTTSIVSRVLTVASSHTSTPTTSTSIPETKENPAKKFHAQVSKHKGLFICTCNKEKSGCLCAGRRLKSYFPHLDSASVQVFECHGIYNFIDNAQLRTLLESDSYEHIVFTGCEVRETPPAILRTLLSRYHLSKMKEIFIVVPPLHSKNLNDDYSGSLGYVQRSFAGISYPVTLLSCGIDSHPHSLGLPRPCPSTWDSQLKGKIPENYYGLIYVSHTQFEGSDGEKYLHAYLKQVIFAAQSCSVSPIGIAVIANLSEHHKTHISRIASTYGVAINYSPELPQSDFFEMLSVLASRKGIVGLDGMQTLEECLQLGVRPFVYPTFDATDINRNFYQELALSVPLDLQPFSSAILGLNTDFSLLENREKCNQTFAILQSAILDRGINKFETDLAACLAIPKPEEKMIVPETKSDGSHLLGRGSPVLASDNKVTSGNSIGRKEDEKTSLLQSPKTEEPCICRCVIF